MIGCLPGSLICTLKMIFALGNVIPRMIWATFPDGAKVTPPEPAAAAAGAVRDAGNVTCGSTAAVKSVFPTGNLPTWRIYEVTSTACCAVSDPGAPMGMVF